MNSFALHHPLFPLRVFLKDHSLADLREIHGVRYSVRGHLVTLAYDQYEAKIDNEIACLCRGLVISRADGSKVSDEDCVNGAFGDDFIIQAFPFVRFFNYGQKVVASDYDSSVKSSLKILEKLDGTCAIIYFDQINSEWNVATRNVPDGSNFADKLGNWSFRALFEKAAIDTLDSYSAGNNSWESFTDILDQSCTYIFELMTPVNQIVVRHDRFKIALIGVRDIESGKEIDVSIGYRNTFPLAASYDELAKSVTSYDDIVAAANERDPLLHEGFVVANYLPNGVIERFKIKSKAYVSHSHVQDFTTYDIVNHILLGDIDDFVPLMTQDYQKDLVVELSGKIADYCKKVNHEFNELKKLNGSFPTKKDFALHVQKNNVLCQHGRYVYRSYDESVKGVNLELFVDVQESIKKSYYDSNTKSYQDGFIRTISNEWIID